MQTTPLLQSERVEKEKMNKEETKLHQLNMEEKEKQHDKLDFFYGYELKYKTIYVQKRLTDSHKPYTTESRLKIPTDEKRLLKDINTKSIRNTLSNHEFYSILDEFDTYAMCNICGWVYEWNSDEYNNSDMEYFEVNTCCPSVKIMNYKDYSEEAFTNRQDGEAHKSCIEKINNGTMTWEDVIKYKDETDEHWAVKKVVDEKEKIKNETKF